MTPRHKKILLLCAALGHLTLVVLGARDVCLCDYGAPGQLAVLYSALSGADSGYGFFAPKVASPRTARFTLVDEAGRVIVDTLPPRITREADIRVEDLVEMFDTRRIDDEVRAQLAGTWAAAMFKRHPEAVSVTVDMGSWRVPTMAEAREGKPWRWRSIYRARVVRPSRPAGGSP
jgi:hypothetical protein